LVEDMNRARAPNVASVDYLPNNHPWRVLLPPVYRYLPQQFVDHFFDTGELRLSTITQFRSHTDEARLDHREGSAVVRGIGEGREFWAVLGHSISSYILCGSFILSRQIMERFEGAQAAIEIFNVPDFALEVGRQLVGFQNGVSGYCIYGDGASLTRALRGDPFPLPEDGSDIPFERLWQAVGNATQNEEMFIKHRDYSYQAEYRMIWNVDVPPNDPIVVKAPKARDFCRPISAADIG
jgi:hypothetical protein